MLEEKAARRLELRKVIKELTELSQDKGWRAKHTLAQFATLKKAIQLLHDYREIFVEEKWT